MALLCGGDRHLRFGFHFIWGGFFCFFQSPKYFKDTNSASALLCPLSLVLRRLKKKQVALYNVGRTDRADQRLFIPFALHLAHSPASTTLNTQPCPLPLTPLPPCFDLAFRLAEYHSSTHSSIADQPTEDWVPRPSLARCSLG